MIYWHLDKSKKMLYFELHRFGESIGVICGDSTPLPHGHAQPLLMASVGTAKEPLVKRVSLNPATGAVSLISDNSTLYPPIEDIRKQDLTMVGKVVWLGRRV